MQQAHWCGRDGRRGHELALAAVRAARPLVPVDAAHEGLDRLDHDRIGRGHRERLGAPVQAAFPGDGFWLSYALSMRMSHTEYRKRIYARYATQRKQEVFAPTAKDYAHNAYPIIARLRDWLPADRSSKCLDVGCGAGFLLFTLKQAGYWNIAGMDVSPEQVQLARQVCPDVFEADAVEFLRAHTAEYDLVIALDVIEHLRKDELFGFLDALFGALRPGGRAIFQTPNAESPWGLSLRYGDLTHEISFDPQSLSHALRLSGFGDFEARECGPYVHGLKSFVRSCLWKIIRASLAIWNLVECGTIGSGIYTRVFIAKANKSESECESSLTSEEKE